jgi:hypothetical protein
VNPFAAFKRNTNEESIIEKELRAFFPSFAKELLDVLEVGCGDGRFQTLLSTVAAEQGARVSYTGFDPSLSAVHALRQRGLPGRSYVGRLEESAQGRRHGLSVASHSLYYVDPAIAIAQLAELGRESLIIMAGDGPIQESRLPFPEIPKGSVNPDYHPILDQLIERGCYINMFVYAVTIDLHTTLDPESEEGNALAAFMLETSPEKMRREQFQRYACFTKERGPLIYQPNAMIHIKW